MMKMKQLFVIILVFTLATCSCGRKTDSKVDPLDVDCVADTYTEDEEGLSHFSDTLTMGQYHQMILEAIANGDKQLFAKMGTNSYLLKWLVIHCAVNTLCTMLRTNNRWYDTLTLCLTSNSANRLPNSIQTHGIMLVGEDG